MLAKPTLCSFCGVSFDSRMQLFRHLRDPLVACSGKANLNENINEKVCLLFGYFGPKFSGPGAKYNHQYNNSSNNSSNNEDVTQSYFNRNLVETNILSALSAVTKQPLPSLENLCLSVASHTDKGVYACVNVLACKLKAGLCHRELVSMINQQLSSSIRVFGAMPVPASFHASVFCERKRYEYWVPLTFFTQPGGLVSPSSHLMLLWDRTLTKWIHSLSITAASSSFATSAATSPAASTSFYFLEKGDHFLRREHLDFSISDQTQFEISVRFSGKATLRFALRQKCSNSNDVWYVAAREQMLTEVSHLLGNLKDVKWQRFDAVTKTVISNEYCSLIWDQENSSSSSSGCIDAFGLLVSCPEAQTMELEHIRVIAPSSERNKLSSSFFSGKEISFVNSESKNSSGEEENDKEKNKSDYQTECDRLLLLSALKPILKKFVGTSSFATTASSKNDVTITNNSNNNNNNNSKKGHERQQQQQAEQEQEQEQEEDEALGTKAKEDQEEQQLLSFHNFSRGVSSHEPRAKKQVAVQALGFRRIEGEEYLGFSLSARRFLFGMPLKIMGLVLALARNLLPLSVLDVCFDASITIDIPSAPSHLLLLAECAFGRFEVGSKMQINPRVSNYTKGFVLDGKLSEEMYVFRNNVLGEMQLDEKINHKLESWIQTQATEQACAIIQKLNHSSIPMFSLADACFSACPPIFARALRLLRAADKSGLWPSSSVRRSALLEQGGSFTLGYMPPPLSPPAANSLFPELYESLMQLEARLCPSRPPSSTIAVNRHASFRPHRDSGAGAGQGISLIVGLGDYEGGELACDPLNTDGPPETHGIRYKPLLFHGWDQRHWTLPFRGERFSIVWFTPKGCEKWQSQMPIPAVLPQGVCSCCARCVHAQQDGCWSCWYCDSSNRTTWRCAFNHCW